jgi:hypothetical protein
MITKFKMIKSPHHIRSSHKCRRVGAVSGRVRAVTETTSIRSSSSGQWSGTGRAQPNDRPAGARGDGRYISAVTITWGIGDWGNGEVGYDLGWGWPLE